MSTQKPAELFDAYYYAHDCGVPYERNDHWFQFFGKIADKIVSEIRPRTVLDAGCAMGFLVESLRQRGVEAFGVDISEYAISQVHEDIRPYCWIGSVAEPFPQTYDLIVNIEVLEHMSPWDAEKAIENLSSHTSEILFSSSPFDYKEVTHFNVHPPEYWATMFARYEFYRDVDFDASFLTPWAVRYRRRRDSVSRLVGEYERKFWLLWKENTDLRSLGLDMQRRLDYFEQYSDLLKQSVEAKDQIIQETGQTVHQRNLTIQQQNKQLVEKEYAITALNAHIEDLRRLSQRTIDALLKEKEQQAAEMQRFLSNLQQSIAAKDKHIIYLEALLKQIEAGHVMKLLRTLDVLKQQGPGAAIQTYRTLQAHESQDGIPHQQDTMDEYQVWIGEYEPQREELDQQRTHIQTFAYLPFIDIITPVYNPSPQVLTETIESVIAQTYPHWNLYLVDGHSTIPEVKNVLEHYAHLDQRIQVISLDHNLGISGNSNQGLRKGKGEFVAFLDHDDLFAPNLLYEVVAVLQTRSDADIVYYDEDKISADGKIRNSPWFKPAAWSPDLLLSVNYLMHSVIRRSLIDDVGGFNPAMDGAQDWDLSLRCSRRTQSMVHIPKVLYHWRQVEGSAARDARAKPWAFAAQARCIAEHLKHLGIKNPRITFPQLGRVRIFWPISGKKVSMVIPTKDKVEILRACLTSIVNLTQYPNYEIILVDTGSIQPETQQYYETLESDPRIHVINFPGPFNFSATNNLGVTHARGEVLLFLNNDTEVREADWLDELVGWVERPEVGIVGCKLIRPDGTIQHAGYVIGVEGHGSHIFDGCREDHYGFFGSSEWYRNYMAVTGACMMIRREVFDQLGGFDEAYQVGYSDITLCLKAIQQGYRVVYTPFARLVHHEGATRGFSVPPQDVVRAYFEMLPFVQVGDSFFNPNLSHAHRQPTLRKKDEQSPEQRLGDILKMFGLIEDNVLAHYSKNEPEQPLDLPLQGYQGKDKQPSILLVSHDLSLSGAPLVLYTLAKYLVTHGFLVTVLSAAEGPLYEYYAKSSIDMLLEPDILFDVRASCRFIMSFDVILANTIVSWRSVVAAKAYAKPCIWWIHESSFGQKLIRSHEAIAATLSSADAVIFPSRATAQLYEQFNRQGTFYPIHNGLDLEMFAGNLNTFSKEADKFYVVCIASIESRKGQDILLHSISNLPEQVQQHLEVYLVGRILDWDFEKKLQRMNKHLKNVHIVGEVSRERASSYLQSADVFVLPSRDEALPISLIEAMYYGKAIVASNAGGTSEIINHHEHGLIFEVENHGELTQHLLHVFHDRAFLQTLGKNAYTRFHEYLTMERFGQEMLSVIRRVVWKIDTQSGHMASETMSDVV